MSENTSEPNTFFLISLSEASLFLLINIILILLGIILWYFLWIRRYGAEIHQIINDTAIHFSSRNLGLVLKELSQRIMKFDITFLKKTIGHESYVYLLFQRKVISVLCTYFILAIIFSLINSIIQMKNYTKENILTMIYLFFVDNQLFNTTTNPIIQMISIALVTFFHFRCFYILKKEAQYLYFTRFDQMSQKRDSDWLSCRTLHISGIAPNERNTTALQNKLNYYLNMSNSGKVIDINFIPNYQDILHYEKKRTEINDLKSLISQKNSCTKCCFSSIYWSNETIESELNYIEGKLQECTERPVFSSGHAFICFDSLSAYHQVQSAFHDSSFNKLKMKVSSLYDTVKGKKYTQYNRQKSTFQTFKDDNDLDYIIDNDAESKINILVDELIEPCDIIWDNVGGDRGLYFWRRIFLNIAMVFLLIFFTTPTSLLTTLKHYDYYSVLDFNWMIKIPFGHLLITYIPPLIVLSINLGLITLIDVVARFEKHYTHSNYQYSIFGKSFIYMMFNFLIIPGIALTANSLYSIVKSNMTEILQLLSNIYLSNPGYFFVTLIIQNGTISSIFYLLRIDELIFNSFSTQIVFFRRHFINTGNVSHRKESDCFQFGYFYAQQLIFYAITLVFSSTMPIISLAGLYFFIFRHFSDFTSFLMIHEEELDSNGKLINHILNFSYVPVIIFQLTMLSLFLVREQYYYVIAVAILLFVSIIYVCVYNTYYLQDIYAIHKELVQYEHNEIPIRRNEVNKWRNKFRHPMVIPVFIDEENNAIHEIKGNDEGIMNNGFESKVQDDSIRRIVDG